MNKVVGQLLAAPLVALIAGFLGAAGAAPPTAPSSALTTHQGQGFTISIPGNWNAEPGPSGVTYCAAPDGKRVTRDAAGGTTVSMLLGVAVGFQKTGAPTAKAAADQTMQAYIRDNPGLRVIRREVLRLDGFLAEAVLADGPGDRPGENERNWLLFAVKDGQQFMVAFTSPARDYDRLQGLFRQIAESIRLVAWKRPGSTSASGTTPLQRYVSANPSFALFKPADWRVRADTAGGALRITVSDPEGTSFAENIFAANPQGRYNSLKLLAAKADEIRLRHPDLTVSDVQVCRDQEISCAAATLAYTVQGVPISGRFYFHADNQLITVRSFSAPAPRLQAQRALLLDILANIRVRGGMAPIPVTLVDRRAPDGSLSLSLPIDWTFVAQKGTAMAVAPGGGAGFVFTAFQVMPSNYGVAPPPGVIVSGYALPADFAPTIFAKFGNRNIRVLGATPDPRTAADCPRRIGRICDAADVQLTWVSPEGAACIGSFKLLDARPGPTGQWFSIVAGMWGPGNDLAQYLPVLEQIGASFRIDDAYARGYIQNGLAHLRAQQQKTRQAMQGLYDAIHANQTDYESRVARKEASDARADDYRRGNSYWISDLEGGKVYATDPWGTKDTRTGDRYDGAAQGYIHFEGQNPAHRSEYMREVSSHELKQMGYQ